MPEFTEDQITDMEDKILNYLSPVYIKLQMVKRDKPIQMKDVDMMIGRIEAVTHYIRALRPIERTFKRNRMRLK